MAYYLGIDIGTSGTKALVADTRAKVLATATVEYGVSSPRPGWSEQAPQQWWRATVKAARAAIVKAKIDAGKVAGVGLSGLSERLRGSLEVGLSKQGFTPGEKLGARLLFFPEAH